ncbi:MAG TPA: Rrf2 family transcriptional regulator [Stellaceae bacterium]|jgi:Rrf2 family nitric oxide-sensitive transcriptional repressor|nr:Rrf2 family transcriptional regulator [Stellaceae bacterium]
MRLTLHTDFALRVLIHAGLKEGRLSTIKDVAESFGISKNHLMKVVHDLGQKGYLDTVRGRNGGIRLMRPPHEINIGQVVRDTEDELDIVGCLQSIGYCRIEDACVLRGVVREATDAFLAVFDSYTLADLIEPKHALAMLLLESRQTVGA